jgi:hypothetical protein
MASDPDERLRVQRQRDLLRLEREQQALEARAEPNARRGTSAKLLDEVVVTSAAADGACARGRRR